MTEHKAGAPKKTFPAGVVEGFYGPPWSHAARLWMIRIIASLGMNHYIYAPKDDPRHRELWRDPYGPEEEKRFGELARACADSAVTFNFALSPGLSIVYTDRRDRQKLVDKYLSLADQGVRAFSLFLDDIPPGLRQEADRAAFGDFGQAHADLANDLRRRLADRIGSGVELLFCPTEYAGMEPSAYLEALGGELDRRIPVFWTGPRVVSPSITCADARAFGALIDRKPYLWDNYPVNDFAPNRLFAGPLRNREPGLDRELAGYAANPMNQARASQVALRTLAAWLADPSRYDPDLSWQAALRDSFRAAAGTGAAHGLDAAFETVAPLFKPSPLDDVQKTPLSLVRGAQRAALAATYGEAAERLLAAAGENELLGEISGWLRDIVLRCRAVEAASRAQDAARTGNLPRAKEIAAAVWSDRVLVGRRHRLASEDEMHWADGTLLPLRRAEGELVFDSGSSDGAAVVDAGQEIRARVVTAFYAKPWMKPLPSGIPRLSISVDGDAFEPLPAEERQGCAVAKPGSCLFRYIRIDASEGCGVYLAIDLDPSPIEEPSP